MEKLTVSFVAVLHGDEDAIAEAETFEAETKEELLPLLIRFMEDLTQGFREQLPEGAK